MANIDKSVISRPSCLFPTSFDGDRCLTAQNSTTKDSLRIDAIEKTLIVGRWCHEVLND